MDKVAAGQVVEASNGQTAEAGKLEKKNEFIELEALYERAYMAKKRRIKLTAACHENQSCRLLPLGIKSMVGLARQNG